MTITRWVREGSGSGSEHMLKGEDGGEARGVAVDFSHFFVVAFFVTFLVVCSHMFKIDFFFSF